MSKHRKTRKKLVLSRTMTIAEVEEYFLKEFIKLRRPTTRKSRRNLSIDKPEPADAWANGCSTACEPTFVKPAIH